VTKPVISGSPETRETRVDERDQRIRALEAELAQARQIAEDTLRSRDEMLASVAHDMRNPLSTILMGATALCDLGPTPPTADRVKSIAERIQRQANRMVLQVAGLTDLLEIQAGRLAVNRTQQVPAEIIAQVAVQLAPIARERNVELITSAPSDLPKLACDADRVAQALINLGTTAAKVTSSGGTIELGARRDGDRVVFYVRDRGPGIAAGDLAAAMFDPAWKSPHISYRGAGLVFAIARGIVVAHGGRIWADSAPGATTVSLSLTPED
jgi:signal transduction histidine kinase